MSKKLNESAMQRYRMLLEYSIRDGQTPTGDSYYGGDKRVELKEADPVLDPNQGYQKAGAEVPEVAPEVTPVSDADAMIPNMDDVENPDATPTDSGNEVSMEGDPKNSLDGTDKPEVDSDPNESREDILSQLIQLHADKLQGLEDFATQMLQRAQGYDATVEAIPEITAKISQIIAQVDELTPDTPLQAMAGVPEELGGTTPEDWWNSYWANKNQSKQLSSSPYYPQQKGDRNPLEQMGQKPANTQAEKPVYYMKASDLPDLGIDQAKDSFAPKMSY